MTKGYLSLVLHAHLPFIHHPESEEFIEERWLFEAITESYIPLLDVFERLANDGVDFRITMSMTPTLLSMLSSPMLQKRYIKYIDNLIALSKQECKRTKKDKAFFPLSTMYREHFIHIRKRFIQTYEGDLINGFKRFQASGHLELITSSATHAFLPYVKTEQALRAQIENAVRIHTDLLGRAPQGIWLPECGFVEGLDRILKEYGITFFLTDTHHVLHASPKPVHDVYGPVLTPHGAAAFARDHETSKQVWSSLEGYPGDYDYREYYKDIGYDLDYDYVLPYLHPSGVRLNTGIKYYRITGGDQPKEPYYPEWAREKAARHAGNFMFNREKQIEHLSGIMDRKPIIVASYDAELFGHWWYEGPMWIEFLCRKIHYDQDTVGMITPAEYLQEYPDNQQCELSFSSWGRGGYGEVWLGQNNEWIYRHLHQMEERMIELADSYEEAEGLRLRALNQASRELMLAQSSDWAFIMDTQTMVEYAIKRTNNHIGRFQRIYENVKQGEIDEGWLREVEARDSIFPHVDYRTYRSKPVVLQGIREALPSGRQQMHSRIIMLSWEFPPMTIGGLSRHVFDLSRTLVEQGTEVHVITTYVNGYPAYEINQGIHVHRVRTYQEQNLDFMDWVFQLNLAMTDYTKHLIRNYGPFDLIHAHDWLVGQAAKTLKHAFRLPLVATIHATEHGRNQGVHSELQYRIHNLEGQLTYEAWRVIVCSKHMVQEIKQLFHLPAEKIDMIPNGVDPALIRAHPSDSDAKEPYALPEEKVVLFVGRLVREKGVQVLLQCIPAVLDACPEAKFVIGGSGAMMEELQEMARALGIAHKTAFIGFVDDQTRNHLLHIASAAVFPSLYEPFGIVALEAMAAGTPVIVSGVGGLQEIIQHGEDGFTVLPGDVPSLSAHLVAMLQFEDMARSMAKKAFQKVNTLYDWDRIAEQTSVTYNYMLNKLPDGLLYKELAAAREA
ncbi:1,4-alpha-glucan branching protein domain-containing protein [Paenibacillus solisilvae]|uniref:1,4-alpha-glucan branching protein domain-containing protein n=1 Tax=Paenibacillus solisilvae TaxID=2486751 RepID=A0ABW0VR41_9BACL